VIYLGLQQVRQPKNMTTQNVIVQLKVSHQDLQLVRNTPLNALFEYKPNVEDPKPSNLFETMDMNLLPAISSVPTQEGVIRCANDLSELDNAVENQTTETVNEPNALDPRHCWHDCHPFYGTMIGLPIRMEGDNYITEGQFCSYACAKAYAVYEKRHTNKFEGLLSMMFRSHITQKRDANGKMVLVPMAPPRSALKAFGGSMTITEFREKTNQGEKYEKLAPIQIPINMFYAENELSKVKRLKIKTAKVEDVQNPTPKETNQPVDVLNMLGKWT
jgi:hypothetical protein